MATYKADKLTITVGNNTHNINSGNVDNTLEVVIVKNIGTGEMNIKLDTGNGDFGDTYPLPAGEDVRIDRAIDKFRVIHVEDTSYTYIAY